MPSVHIPVTQEDPEITETPNYTPDSTPAISGEITMAEPEMNEEMAEADTETERAWNPRGSAASVTSDDVEFFTSNDIMQAVLTMGTQMKSLTEGVQDLKDQNAEQISVIFEFHFQVQQLTQQLKKKPTTPLPNHNTTNPHNHWHRKNN